MSKEQTLLDHALTNSNENEAINSLRKLRKMKVEATVGGSSSESILGDYTVEDIAKVITQLENKSDYWQARFESYQQMYLSANDRADASHAIALKAKMENAKLILEKEKLSQEVERRKNSDFQVLISAIFFGGLALIVLVGILAS